MPLQPKFNRFTTATPAIVTFDFFDFASATGYKRFFGFQDSDDNYALTTNTIYSEEEDSVVATSFDQDFDIQFKKVLTVEGVTVANMSTIFENTGGSAVTPAYVLTVKVIHYDGSTETVLGTTVANQSWGLTGSGAAQTQTHAILIDTTQKAFAPSDILRINIVMTEATGGKYYILHDPQNRTVTHVATADTSVMSFDIPFNIE